MKRGEIYWADLRPRSGSEQKERRPVIGVSHDRFNQTPSWRSVIVVPVSTSGIQARRGPTAVYLPKGAGGLERNSVALCHRVTTLDRNIASCFGCGLCKTVCEQGAISLIDRQETPVSHLW